MNVNVVQHIESIRKKTKKQIVTADKCRRNQFPFIFSPLYLSGAIQHELENGIRERKKMKTEGKAFNSFSFFAIQSINQPPKSNNKKKGSDYNNNNNDI